LTTRGLKEKEERKMEDTHRWEGEELCPVCKWKEKKGGGWEEVDDPSTRHAMVCVECGVRRTACAEPGAYHYWMYTTDVHHGGGDK